MVFDAPWPCDAGKYRQRARTGNPLGSAAGRCARRMGALHRRRVMRDTVS
jgi:hypothetical protein